MDEQQLVRESEVDLQKRSLRRIVAITMFALVELAVAFGS